MRKRRNSSSNVLVLAILPIFTAIGWAVARILRKRRAASQVTPSQATIPVSGPQSITSARSLREKMVSGTYEATPEGRLRETKETGIKEPGQATKFPGRSAPEQPREAAEVLPTGHALHAGYIGRAINPPENQPESPIAFFVLLVPFLILAAAIILLAFNHTPVQSQVIVPGGDVNRGQAALQSWGCGSCHTIPGIPGADGKVGPALSGLTNRSFIAGHLENTPDNMIQWIMHPQQISPGVDMPDTGVPASVARDMAAYLYSIK